MAEKVFNFMKIQFYKTIVAKRNPGNIIRS